MGYVAQATYPTRRQLIYPSVASCVMAETSETAQTSVTAKAPETAPGPGRDERRRAARAERRAARLSRQIGAFAGSHGGAEGVLTYLGQMGTRIVLVGADGTWGDLVAPSYEVAESAARKADLTLHESFDGEFAARVRTGPYEWSRMAGIQVGGPSNSSPSNSGASDKNAGGPPATGTGDSADEG